MCGVERVFSKHCGFECGVFKGASCMTMGEFSETGPLNMVTVLGLHVVGKLLFPEGTRVHL